MADLPTLVPDLKQGGPVPDGETGSETNYMGRMSDSKRTPSHAEPPPAALVGWNTMQMGDRLILQLQSVTTPPPHRANDVTSHYYVITKNQAVQLGNYLFQVTGQTAPRKHKRGMIEKLLGG